MIKQKLYFIIEGTETLSGKIFDYFIQFLIITSIISFTFETVPGIHTEYGALLKTIEIISVIIFTIEYLLRVYIAKEKLSYIFSFYGFIDLIAILPFYISTGIDLRSIRIFRLFRVFRLLKLLRFSDALRRYRNALRIIKSELIVFLGMSVMMIYIASVGIYYFEHEVQPDKFTSVFHSMWWAVATLTTIGYGDMYPITTGGKLFTTIVVFIGLGVVAVPTGLFASAITRTLENDDHKTQSR